MPVVVTTGAWLCQYRLLWRVRSCTTDELLSPWVRLFVLLGPFGPISKVNCLLLNVLRQLYGFFAL